MARLVLDASVVIALLDERDGHHERALVALRATRADEKVLPASAYAEVLVAPMRAGADDLAEFDQTLRDVPVMIEPISPEIARAAAALRARHTGLRLGDALVLGTGQVLAATILTADRAWARYARNVRVI